MKDEKPDNLNKQLRLTAPLLDRVKKVVETSSFSEADVLRSAIEAGLTALESGEYNPFSAKKAHPAARMGLALAGMR